MKLKNVLKRAGAGVGCMVILNFAVSCILGVLIWKEVVPLSLASALSGIMGAVIVFFVCMLTLKNIPQSKLPVALGMSLAYTVLALFLGNAAVSSDPTQITWFASMPFAAAAMAGVLGSRKKGRRR